MNVPSRNGMASQEHLMKFQAFLSEKRMHTLVYIFTCTSSELTTS